MLVPLARSVAPFLALLLVAAAVPAVAQAPAAKLPVAAPAPAPVAKGSVAPAAPPVAASTPAVATGAYVQIAALAYTNPIGYQILMSGPYVVGSSIAFTIARPLPSSVYPSAFDVTFTGSMQAIYHRCRVAAVSQAGLPTFACPNLQSTAVGTATALPGVAAGGAAATAPPASPPAKTIAKPAATP